MKFCFAMLTFCIAKKSPCSSASVTIDDGWQGFTLRALFLQIISSGCPFSSGWSRWSAGWRRWPATTTNSSNNGKINSSTAASWPRPLLLHQRTTNRWDCCSPSENHLKSLHTKLSWKRPLPTISHDCVGFRSLCVRSSPQFNGFYIKVSGSAAAPQNQTYFTSWTHSADLNIEKTPANGPPFF